MNPVRRKITTVYQKLLKSADDFYGNDPQSPTIYQDRIGSAHIALLIQGDFGRQVLRQFINLPFKHLVVVGLTSADSNYLGKLNERMTSSEHLSLIDAPYEDISLGFMLSRAQLVVMVSGRPLPQAAQKLNQASIHTGTPWLHSHVWGVNFVLGPTFIPGTTACYDCYQRRLLANSPQVDADSAIQHYLAQDANFDFEGQFPAMNRMLASFVTAEVVTYLSGRQQPKTLGEEMTIVPMVPSQGIGFNFVPRVEWCPTCNDLVEKHMQDDAYTLESVVRSYIPSVTTVVERG